MSQSIKSLPFLNIFKTHNKVAKLLDSLNQNNSVNISGLSGSSFSTVLFTVYNKMETDMVVVLNDYEEAVYMFNEAQSLIGETECDLLLSGFRKTGKYDEYDPEKSLLRSETIRRWVETERKPLILFAYPESLIESTVSEQSITKNTVNLKCGEQISVDFLTEVLESYSFQQVDFVYEPGQFATRGSIIDIFSFANSKPYRVDFFGDTVESIRTFNVETQISDEIKKSISIIPDISNKIIDENRVPVPELFIDNTLIAFSDYKYFDERITHLFNMAINSEITTELPINQLLVVPDVLNKSVDKFKRIYKIKVADENSIHFSTENQPEFSKNFNLLYDVIVEKQLEGYSFIIVSEQERQLERIKNALNQFDKSLLIDFVLANIHSGFIENDLRVVVFTDHQIFDRYQKYRIKSGFSKRESLIIEELTELRPGDYIVHSDYGIGRFGGLEKIDVQGVQKEVVKLVYRDNDFLYINIHALHKISKYKSNDGLPPKLHKLGSSIWNNAKNNAKRKIKDIARELISLYAERLKQSGFAFSPDTSLSEQLEASFIYEDTPDQEETTKAVKTDMENSAPMDRLICGDVGFGKTEIAIRAAFKAVYDNKQVAVLVPTTILALQHFQTFSQRLNDFPVKVDYLTRMRSAAEQSQILKDLKDGKVNILIGTHRIVSNDVVFNDLGLLVVDEEQKFGVAVKEKLRALKVNVDTLTMTATPIPRTLQFSLMGARDLSIIKTPPPNRHPINTEIHTFNETLIKEAINNEISRGGQVFFINNKIHNIADIQVLINKICPKVKTAYAHGQMEGKKLEKIMLDFIEERYDVLIATTIIESGVDIPNVNTIIINDAQNFGLSDLHQLRGRVGRSNKKAYCYLLAPPLSLLPAESRRRLQAVEMFTDLGSGFNIALQDLNIRGAGNLLGGEQSGFIADLGYETYQRVLQEAVYELKEQEFKNLLNNKMLEVHEQEKLNIKDCTVETDLPLHIPNEYVSNLSERLKLYKQLDELKTESEIEQFKTILKDRFGTIPNETLELIEVIKLRQLGVKLGFEKIVIRQSKMTCYFDSDPQSEFFNSKTFNSILQFLQSNSNIGRLNEHSGKLRLMFYNEIKTIKRGIEVFEKIEV